MEITVLTLFPSSLRPFVKSSILGKGVSKKLFSVKLINFRDFATDARKTVDGYQAGGGPGMVIMADPVLKAIEKFKGPKTKVIMMSPQGKRLNQQMAKQIAVANDDLILICGHYEGFDERIMDYVDQEISIGDYVLMGGEAAAAVLIESVVRLLPGVIKADSLNSESHDDYLLDHPVYTKPNNWNGKSIPPVLLSGNHKLIEAFRLQQRISRTKLKRPDLYKKYMNSRSKKNEQN